MQLLDVKNFANIQVRLNYMSIEVICDMAVY